MRDIDNERQEILKHCRRLTGPDDLETMSLSADIIQDIYNKENAGQSIL